MQGLASVLVPHGKQDGVKGQPMQHANQKRRGGFPRLSCFQKEYFNVIKVVMPESTISDSARLFFPTCDQYE